MTFNNSNANPDAVAEAGNHFFLSIFASTNADDLDILRHQCYLRTIAKQPVHANFSLSLLPPTSSTAHQHSYRVYHQVQHWLNVSKDPLKWGLKKIDGYRHPFTTTKTAAPEKLLCLIVCTCNEGCVKNCECRNNGLKCSTMCRNCSGHGCTNSDALIIDDNIDEDDYELQHDELSHDELEYF